MLRLSLNIISVISDDTIRLFEKVQESRDSVTQSIHFCFCHWYSSSFILSQSIL